MGALSIEIVFLLPGGKKRVQKFKTELEVAEHLKATYTTEAPLSFTYTNGKPLDSHAINRIYAIVFAK